MSIALLALGALVMTADTPGEVEASVALVSDYRSRGLSSSDERPAIQAGLTWAHSEGAYIGAWASSLEWSGDARSEFNLFAGVSAQAWGLEWDASLTAYAFPGQSDTAYGELTLAASRDLEWATKTFGVAYAPAQSNLDSANSYWFVETEAPLGERGLSLIAAVGLEDGPLGDLAEDGGEKWDWTLGVTGAVEGLGWSLAYMDSTEDSDLADAHIVFALERSF